MLRLLASSLAVWCGIAGAQAPRDAIRVRSADGRESVLPSEPAGQRQGGVEVDAALFNRSAAKRFRDRQLQSPGSRWHVRMTLFEGVTLQAGFEHAAVAGDGRTIVWTGRVNGDPLSSVVLVAGAAGVTANLRTGGGRMYRVRPVPAGVHIAREVDERRFPDEAVPFSATPGAGPAMAGAPAHAEGVSAASGEGPEIDVLAVYTPLARAHAGSDDAMRQLVHLGIAETNQGYANSRIAQRVRLVGTRELAYAESGSLETDLERLTQDGDGYLDEVHAARDAAGADLVSLWVGSGNTCGMSWQMPDRALPAPGKAFSVVRSDCATGYYSFGHELGHNMGAMHARDDGGERGAFDDSHGFKFTGAVPHFRTVMAYTCTGGCSRVNYWSSPEIAYRGLPLSAAAPASDNRSTLNRSAAVVAAYRPTRVAGEAAGTLAASQETAAASLPESAHPYAAHSSLAWKYTAPGNPTAIFVTFHPATYVEEGYDWIAIYDEEDHIAGGGPFTGAELGGATVRVPGAVAKIRLAADESVNGYGFKVTRIVSAQADGNPEP